MAPEMRGPPAPPSAPPGPRCALAGASLVSTTRRGRQAARRGGRAVEGARLESVYGGNSIAGSNPNDTAMLGDLSQTVWTIVNQGVIQETGNVPSYGIRLFSAGTISNTGLIKANGGGIVMPSGLVANYGTIIGVAGAAVALST